MDVEANKQLVERMFSEIIPGKNPDAMDQLISSKFAHHASFDEKPGVEGFKEILKGFQTAFPDLKIHVQKMVAEGDEVATRGYMTGTNKGSFMGIPATNKEVRIDYIDWWKFENGKAIENWVQMDIPGLMTQLGTSQSSMAESH